MNNEKLNELIQSKSFLEGVTPIGMSMSWYPPLEYLLRALLCARLLAASYLLLEIAISISSLAVNKPTTPSAFFAMLHFLFMCEVLL